MGDYRDIQNGVNDPVNGVDVKASMRTTSIARALTRPCP